MNPRALAESLDGHNVRLTLRGKTLKPEGTMAGCGEWGLTITSGIGGLIRYAYGEIDHIEDLGQPTPAAPASLTDHMVTIARARLLAADYQANPTPARAHNAAQVLGAVLNQLDAIRAEHSDCAERLGESWDYGDKMEAERDTLTARLAAELDMPPLAELPEGAANHWAALDRAHAGQLRDFATEHLGFTDADKPTAEQITDLVAKHMRPAPEALTAVAMEARAQITDAFSPDPDCGESGCVVTIKGHRGAVQRLTTHTEECRGAPRAITEQHTGPGFPTVVPADQLPPATGGIVDTTTVARIGDA